MNRITEEEQLEVTNMLKEDIASGISEISYRLIKKVSSKTKEYLIKFANKIVYERKFPKKQKLEQIYLIPKNTDQKFNLASTRPIMLFKIIRKLVIKIVQKKLSKVFIEKQF